MLRRTFLSASALGVLGLVRADSGRPPRILLRSSWQDVNIGDIAHTPGVLALIEKYIPDAEVILWASGGLSEPVIAMEKKRFPKLKVVKGRIGDNGSFSSPALGDAVKWADFLLHGSGPSLVGRNDVVAFAKHMGKPYGVYGITYGGSPEGDRKVYSNAKFLFFRDTVSLAKAKEDGIDCPIMEFGPDGAFAVDVRDDASALAFMNDHGLEEGKFLCCIPRLRMTPYWKIRNKSMTEKDHASHALNEKMKENDHTQLRAAIEAIVAETDFKVLVCPEDMSQMAIGKEMIVDKLPAKVRDRVVWREKFWLTDEAVSTYTRSVALFGNEMHSPIMCVGNGIPAVVCRWDRQTSKGFMWRDIGLGDWLFDTDNPVDRAKIAPTVLAIAKNPDAARERVKAAQKIVTDRQQKTMAILKSKLR